MDVNTLTAQPIANTATAQSDSKGDQSASSDFETFLKLLTTQLQNQDPLKPLESTEFVAQLANFSAVEQQVKTNDVLAQIQGLLGGASATGLTSWIGTDVRALRDAEFVGTPIDVFIAPKTGADSAALVVKNANGETVQTLPVSLDEDVVQWAGVADDGTPLPSGTYSLRLESFQGDQKIGDTQVPIYSKVREARIDGDKTLLVLGDGSIIAADQVTAIRGSLQPNL